jgi:hypothetical protein
MAVALELGFEYVHHPFGGISDVYEGKYFDFARCFRQSGDDFLERRFRTAFIGQCADYSWLSALNATGRLTVCPSQRRTVYMADNCWDHFWCVTMREAKGRALWYDAVLPVVRALYMAPRQSEMDALLGQGAGLGWGASVVNVVCHIRRGDAITRSSLDNGYYLRIFAAVRLRLDEEGAQYRFWVHTDDDNETIQAAFSAADTSIMRNAPMRLLAHQMITADVFITSISSLSYSFALLANTTTLFPACDSSRPLHDLRQWHAVPCDSTEYLNLSQLVFQKSRPFY